VPCRPHPSRRTRRLREGLSDPGRRVDEWMPPPRGVALPRMAAAIGWGALAASSLVIGALLGLARSWSRRPVGLVLAFGAGALISAVSFDLAQEGAQVGDPAVAGLGLAIGAVTYFALDRLLVRRGGGSENAGTALALG